MKVHYYFTKLTPKAARKKELCILFENSDTYTGSKQKFLERLTIQYTRKQTASEMEAAEGVSREFTKYNYFIDDKPWNGDIEMVLDHNYLADKNHVSQEERIKIKELLFKAYFEFYNLPVKQIGQISLRL